MFVSTTAVALVVLSGCSNEQVRELKALGLPEAASSSADHIFPLWIGSWIAAGVIGVFVWGLMVWAVIRYRKRGDEVPTQIRYHLPLEVLYTVVPFVVIFVLFYHTVVTQNDVLNEENPDYQVVVVGQQWSWSFNHLGEDGLDATGAPASETNDVHVVGTPADAPELVLPVDRRVQFTLRSQDVIHSFWIPAFYFKMDVVPGRENSWVTTPTEEGEFTGKCAELCGLYHSRMLFTVRVVSQAEYDAYIEELRARGDTGAVFGKSDVDTVAGLESEGENGGSGE
ncbi:MAG: cytochrome c oxidase subunit II [Propionibacteriales bacterium]|nr:cytochrome c oxidase subunit II [Propionibacteriales bacterium]